MAAPTWNDNSKSYLVQSKPNPKDRIHVVIGDDKDPSDIHPQMKLERWDNEANISFRLNHSFIPGQVSHSQKDGVITWKKKQGQKEWIARFYEDTSVAEGGYKFAELVMPEKPSTNIISFSVQSKDVDFLYQPALTQAEIDEGVERPPEIVGSYALYAHTPKKNIMGGKEYKTGKIGHLYRPKLIDANGNESWADYNDDLQQTNTLSITIDQTWLDNAVYPVLLDPSFGYTPIGASAETPNADAVWGTIYNLGSNQDIVRMSGVMFLTAGTCNAKTVMYSVSSNYPDAKLVTSSGTTATTAVEYKHFLVNYSATSGDHFIAGVGDGTIRGRFDTDSGVFSYTRGAAGYYTTPPDPFGGSVSDTNRKRSFYASYASDYPEVTPFASSVTSMPVTLPPAIASGELLFAFVEVRNSGTWTVPTDWNELDAQLGGGSVGELTCFYKIADGTEGASATWTASAGTTAIWHTFRIADWHGTTPPELTKTSGDSSAADSPSLSPSWGAEDTIWLSVAGHTAASAAAWSAGPSTYDNFQCDGASSGGAAVSIASARKTVNGASENPGAFTVSGSNRWWAAMTVGIRPVDDGGGGGTVIKDIMGGFIPFAR